MANTDIYPYGQSQEMPAGYPIANDLDTNDAQQSLSAAMGYKLGRIARIRTVFVAANDASDEEKLIADYQCTGTNDEQTIQAAINAIYAAGGGTVKLSKGTFYIDSFANYDANDDGGSYTAIILPADDVVYYDLRIEGTSFGYPYTNTNDTVIRVSNSCYEGLDSSRKYKIFRSPYNNSIVSKSKIALYMETLDIILPYNQKKIMCIDLRYTNKVWMRFVYIRAYISGYNGRTVNLQNPPDAAVEDCVGIRMMGGSNAGLLNTFDSVLCMGFYEGFKLGAEHVIGLNLGALWCVYGYTFGNYPYSECFIHPITLINCSDERNVNLPYFADCGDSRYKDTEDGGQQITIIDYTIERFNELAPGGVLGYYAKEKRPGHFHGEISYTGQLYTGEGSGVQGTKNSKVLKFWEDGHGQRFITRNSAHLLAGSSTERRSYAPNYLQRYWDTDAGKELICTDTANKTWRDTAGNIVT